ncbi:peptidoglycan DD-metalloendopeptidase family protein [Halomonas halocynthiae]|uniref:peptidoglycan DD-metalloendopeptidase family protein n=1 Tax=Halomonas halocynthiae TaxID=176290 RepID=UPI00041DE040|nr:peptidoglycan DD-metalloendopeptidase family protein [Halomonas halocynthiae]
MHKGLLIGGIVIALAGCAVQPPPPGGVRVEDLSKSKAPVTPQQYTVKAGDTLYGIAWRHDMDYRDMARRNNISPPYTLQPGQVLSLAGADGAPPRVASNSDTATSAKASGASDTGAVVATGLAGAGAVAAASKSGGSQNGAAQNSGSLDWLLPDEQSGSASAPGPVVGQEVTTAAGALKDQGAEQVGELKQHTQDTVDSATASVKDARDKAAEAEEQARKQAELAQQQAKDAAAEKAREADEAKKLAEAEARKKAEQSQQAVASKATQKRYTPVADVPWSWPVSGDVTGGFGESSSVTDGIDIAGQKGQSVRAAGPGVVVYAGDGVRGYGNLILLKHNDQYLSAYAHNDSLRVKENDVVDAGDVIATMGDTGADSVRLHFEVRKDGQPQNPLDYLPKR